MLRSTRTTPLFRSGREGVRKTVGIPGTGLSYTEVSGKTRKTGKGRSRDRADSPPPPPEPQHQVELGFFKRLFTPKAEQSFLGGCKAYVEDSNGKASRELHAAAHLADGAFLAGFVAMSEQRLAGAVWLLKQALAKHRTLGRHFEKYGLTLELAPSITEFLVSHIRPCRRGVLLGLAEVHQAQDLVRGALDCLKKLRREMPDDVVVDLSIAELLTEAYPHNKRMAKQVVQLGGNVDNESSIHAALMLDKVQVLRTLGLSTAARDMLTPAVRMTKNCPAEGQRRLSVQSIACQRAVRELVTKEPK